MKPSEKSPKPQKYMFCKLKPKEVNWTDIESMEECTCFHLQAWDNYVHSCGYQTFIAEIKLENEVIGYFVGTILGHIIKAICSPLDSLGYTQGVVLKESISTQERILLYQEFAAWIFRFRHAQYISIDDWQLREDRNEWTDQFTWKNKLFDNANLKYSVRPTLYLPMDISIEELWDGLKYKSAKYCINKTHKLGLYTRVITSKQEIKDFIDIHYDQICDVCQRHQAGKPKLGQSKRRLMLAAEALFPNNVLMIQVLMQDKVLSSAMFFIGANETIYNTGASYQRYQKYCPNELMVWEAIRLLKERGVKALNFGGMGHYKLKFGTVYAYVPRLIFSKYSILDDCRNIAKQIYHKFFR